MARYLHCTWGEIPPQRPTTPPSIHPVSSRNRGPRLTSLLFTDTGAETTDSPNARGARLINFRRLSACPSFSLSLSLPRPSLLLCSISCFYSLSPGKGLSAGIMRVCQACQPQSALSPSRLFTAGGFSSESRLVPPLRRGEGDRSLALKSGVNTRALCPYSVPVKKVPSQRTTLPSRLTDSEDKRKRIHIFLHK